MRYLVLLLAAVLVLSAIVASATVVSSPHDIAYYINSQSTRYVCVNCHTPHQGTSAPISMLLWNRNRAPAPTTYYNSATFDMGPASATNVGPQTKLCLACHDGAASTLVNYPGPGSVANSNYELSNGDISGWAAIGLDLSQEHPVAFVYNQSLDADNNGFPAPAANGYIAGTFKLYDNNTFQCATCHAVHDTATYTGKGSTQVYFLRTTNESSQMCKACHVNR